MDLNSVNISGWLTRDPEIKHLPSGTVVCDLGVAVNGKDESDTAFLDCALFGKVAEAAGKHLGKGVQVIIQGRLKQERWEGRDGKQHTRIKVIGSSCIFLGGGGKRGRSRQDDSEPPADRVGEYDPAGGCPI